MCGRFGAFSSTVVMSERFGATALPGVEDHPPSWNVAPSLIVRAVLERPEEGRLLAGLRWGLVPHWAEDPAIGGRLTNARAETAAGKPAFRWALARRRCLVPADGYYEWQRVENGTRRGGRQPYWITRRDGDLVALAGLWESWRDAAGTRWRTVCLMTTSAGPDVAFIHERMPVLVEPSAWERWLDRSVTDTAALADLLGPAVVGTLRSHPVSSRVNKADVDGPSLIEPVAPEPFPAEPVPTLGL